MFLCTFEHDAVPRNVKPGYPRNLTMERWFIDDNRVNLAKIACLVAYFEYHRIQRSSILMQEGLVKVRRQVLDPQQVYPWSTSSSAMLNVQVNANSTIESVKSICKNRLYQCLDWRWCLGQWCCPRGDSHVHLTRASGQSIDHATNGRQ